MQGFIIFRWVNQGEKQRSVFGTGYNLKMFPLPIAGYFDINYKEVIIQPYKNLRENSIDEADLEMYFCANFEVLGKVEEYELKPNGKQIKVTDANKEEFLWLVY